MELSGKRHRAPWHKNRLTVTTCSRSDMTLCRKDCILLRLREQPVWMAWLTPSSTTRMSARLEKAGMAEAIVDV